MPAENSKRDHKNNVSEKMIGQSPFALDYLQAYHNDVADRQPPSGAIFLRIFLPEMRQYETELHKDLNPGYLNDWAWRQEVPGDLGGLLEADDFFKQVVEKLSERYVELRGSPRQWFHVQVEYVKRLANRSCERAIEIWEKHQEPSSSFYYWVYQHIVIPILEDRKVWILGTIDTLTQVVPWWQVGHFKEEVEDVKRDLSRNFDEIRDAILVLKVEPASARRDFAIAVRQLKAAADQAPRPASAGRPAAEKSVGQVIAAPEPLPAAVPIVPDVASRVDESGIQAGNRASVDSFLKRVLEETGQKVPKAAIWRVAGYTEATEFERWQKGHPSTVGAATKFRRVLAMTPKAFLEALDKLPSQK